MKGRAKKQAKKGETKGDTEKIAKIPLCSG